MKKIKKKYNIIITDGVNEPTAPDPITTTLNPIPSTPNSIPAILNSSQTKGILNVFISNDNNKNMDKK